MALEDFTPDVAEVASVIASRTFVKGSVVGADDNLAGTFNEETRPTDEQVEALVKQALTEIAPLVIDTDETTEAVYALAKTVVARRTAMLVLVSYFEEQLEDANSGYDEIEQLYKDAREALEAAQDDTALGKRGMYSIQTRSEAYGAYLAPDLLP